MTPSIGQMISDPDEFGDLLIIRVDPERKETWSTSSNTRQVLFTFDELEWDEKGQKWVTNC